MSDERLREAERRLRASGRVEDEAALLRERARVGAVPAREVELAAWCGHEVARLATGAQPPAALQAWVDGLSALGREAPLRFLLELGRELRPAWEEAFPQREVVLNALRAAETTLRLGEDRERLLGLAREAQRAYQQTQVLAPAAARCCARVVASAARLVAGRDASPSTPPDGAITRALIAGAPAEAVEGAKRVLAREALLPGAWNERGRVSERELEELVQEAIVDQVGMWFVVRHERVRELPAHQRRARALDVVRRMLETGRVVAAEYSPDEGRYVSWELPVPAALARLGKDWDALAGEPDLADLAVIVGKDSPAL